MNLAKHGAGGKTLANASLKQPRSDIDLLRRIFKLARGSGLTGQERMNLFSDIEARIAKSGSRIEELFGCNARELAKLFVKGFEEMDIRPKTFREFIAQMRVEGYQSGVRGKLWHLFVQNFEPLQQDFRKVANRQVQELNNPKVAPELVNAKGKKISKPVNFGSARKAQQFRIIKKQGSVEFIDEAFVSYSGKGNTKLWALLVEIELKTAAAAKGFRKQIGFAQLRLMADEVEQIEMVVEGTKVVVKPENIIFSPRAIERNAVTLLSTSQWGRLPKGEQTDLSKALRTGDKEEIYDASGFRVQSTSKGLGETFRRVTLAVNTNELEKFVRAIFPGPQRTK